MSRFARYRLEYRFLREVPKVRAIVVLVFVLVIGVFAGVFAQSAGTDQDCAHLEEQVSELTKRVQALERQLKTATTAAPAAPRPKPQPRSQGNVPPLYGEIDGLLAKGEIEKAQNILAERKSTDPPSAMLNTLTREMAVVGKPTPKPWGIEKWYQGKSEANLERGTTLIVFWESWCPHCRNEVPKLQAIYDRLKGQGLGVVGLTRITKSATEEAVISFIEESQVGYPMAKETGEVAAHFNVKGIPAAAVVKDGQIIWRGHPLRLTDDMLKGWL
jgi:thiol-disulfide isomerase/thioredoxin